MCATIVELLRWRAEEEPQREAFTFLVDGETEEVSLTYGELDRRARAIGAELQQTTAAGERVVILCPAGPDFVTAFYGCLYAGNIAVPAPVPHPGQSLALLHSIAKVAQPAASLITSDVRALVEGSFTDVPAFGAVRWLHVDEVADGQTGGWHEPAVTGGSPGCLMLTSGSTSIPKGVIMSHSNLLALVDLMALDRAATPDDHLLLWTPLHFSMGLFQMMLALRIGAPITVLPTAAVLERPVRWLRAMSDSRATMSGAPTFGYDLCTRTVALENLDTLDLSRWRIASVVGEHVRADVLDRFTAMFSRAGFRQEAFMPGYGQTEGANAGGIQGSGASFRTFRGTDLEHRRVSAAGRGDPSARTLLGHHLSPGSPQRLLIVDPESRHVCDADQVGEIWVAGPNVAMGYWNQPEETDRTFHAYLETGEGPFLRTGDLGFVWEGELFITGRLKELIIIRGRNLYPQDIEGTVQSSHPELVPNGGAAFSVEAGGEERLAVVQEVSGEPSHLDEAVAAIRRAVMEQHQVQVYAVALIPAGTIPKTGSGKIQRNRARNAYQEGRLQVLTSSVLAGRERPALPTTYTAAETVTQAALVAIWEAVLGITGIGIYDHFAELGGDSLLSMQVLARANEAELGLTLADLRHNATIAELAAVVGTAPPREDEQALVSGPIPLTPRQVHFFRTEVRRQGRNITLDEIRGTFDPDLVRHALEQLVVHHDALRTRFTQDAHGWHAAIAEREENDLLAYLDVSELLPDDRAGQVTALVQQARSRINIERGPLLQALLIELEPGGENRLILLIHHLVVDPTSFRILADDLRVAHDQQRRGEAIQLPSKTSSLKSWAERLVEYAQSPEAREELNYWVSAIPQQVAPMPMDHPEALGTMGRVRRVFSSISTEETVALFHDAPRFYGTQADKVLLAALARAFRKWSGNSSLLLGLTGHGREPLFADIDISRTVGWFTTQYPCFLDIGSDLTPREEVRVVDETLRRVPNAGIGYGILRFLCRDQEVVDALERLPTPKVTLNYAGGNDVAPKGMSDFVLDAHLKHQVQGTPARGRSTVKVVTTVFGGRLYLRYGFHDSVYEQATIERLAELTGAALRALLP